MIPWWIPTIFLVYFCIGALSRLSSVSAKIDKLFYWLIFFGILSPIIWAIVSVTSNRLVTDSLIFQLFALAGLYLSMILFGAGEHFIWKHWFGFVLAIIGIIVIISTPLSS